MPEASYRRINQLAWPLILSNLTVPLLGVVDTAVVGHLDHPKYLAAVAAGATVFSVLFVGLNFLRMGTTGLAAQAYGRSDKIELAAVLLRAAVVAVSLGLVLILFSRPITAMALQLLGASDLVTPLAETYISIRLWSAPAVLLNYVLLGYFIGVGKSFSALRLMLIVNVTNIMLDVVFVVVLDWQVVGVARASLMAEFVGVIAGLIMLRGLLASLSAASIRLALTSARALKRLFALNFDLLIRTLSLMSAFAFLTAQGARMGDHILAANAVLMNFQLLMAYALDGYANAAETLVGQAQGENDKKQIKLAITKSLRIAFCLALLFTAIWLVFGNTIVNLLTDIALVRDVASQYMIWLVLLPIISVWCFVYDGIYVGLTWSKAMRNIMLVSFAVFIGSWFVLVPFANHGLWAAFLIFMAARGLLMHYYVKKHAVFA